MNPYEVLGIDDRASNRDILNAAARALREKKYSILDIAVAQKKLLNPDTRALVENDPDS